MKSQQCHNCARPVTRWMCRCPCCYERILTPGLVLTYTLVIGAATILAVFVFMTFSSVRLF